jgi:hypothetical protein
MSLFSDLTSRIQPVPETAIAAVAPRDWDRTLASADDKIGAVQARRAKLLEERDAILADCLDGDAGAVKRADQLDKAIADLDRELSRHHSAREQADARVHANNLAKLNKRKAEMVDVLRADVAELHKKGDVVDEKLNDLILALNDFAASSTHIWRKTQSSKVGACIGDMNRGVMTVIGYRLRLAGWPDVRTAPWGLEGDKRKITGWAPHPDYIVANYVPVVSLED